RDDIGATVSSFSPVSAEPPLVLVSLMSDSYPAELFSRPDEPVTRFAVTLLSAGQRVLAGRFAAAGRPAARLRWNARRSAWSPPGTTSWSSRVSPAWSTWPARASR